MTSTEVALPEASLKTNLEGCGFARGGGDIERAEAVAVFPTSGREIKQRIRALSGVVVGIASVRWGVNRWNAGAKATARHHNRNLDHKTGAAQSGERFKW